LENPALLDFEFGFGARLFDGPLLPTDGNGYDFHGGDLKSYSCLQQTVAGADDRRALSPNRHLLQGL